MTETEALNCARNALERIADNDSADHSQWKIAKEALDATAAIATPVAARRLSIQEELVSMYRYKAMPRTVMPGGPIMGVITEVFESEPDDTRIIIETSNGGASLRAEKLSAPVDDPDYGDTVIRTKIGVFYPRVAAGSVDSPVFNELLSNYAESYYSNGDPDAIDTMLLLVSHIDAWGNQQWGAGRREVENGAYAIVIEEARKLVERAEKAEAELESWVHSNRIDELQRELAHKQAIIDRLMLEYCPGEMTAEQIAEWASHQKRAE